mgnify:CR=1 FL=1
MYWSLVLILVPMLGALLLAKTTTERGQSFVAMGVAAVTLLASVSTMTLARSGKVFTLGFGSSPFFQSLLRTDSLAALFSLFSAFVWFAAAIYMHGYMKYEERTREFYTYYLITLGATQGIFLAGNFVILLAFFELMTLTSQAWVTHHQEDVQAQEAGSLYHHLGVLAGIFIGVAIISLYLSGIDLRVGVAALTATHRSLFTVAILLLIAGFGVKAGMVPLHIWLPKAHPVAPTPGSALLSGILIKTGAYGLIRTGQLVDWGQTALVPWVGTLLVIIGVLTMLVGVCLALLQGNAKRLLAYHSISQMGYIILGIGSALVLKQNGALGITGAIFHSLNHALFKSALFFGVGIVILGTGEADLYKLGGLWRKFPFTGLMMFIAALGITGMPGLNGYISKTLLHHGILEAAALGSPIMIWGERLFIVVGVGTTASFVKLIGLTFFGRQKTEVREGRGEGLPLAIAMLLLSVVMLVIGLKPEWALTLLIYPAAQSGGMLNVAALGDINFWEWSAIRDMLLTLVTGFAFFAVGMKTNLFHYEFPAWLSFEGAWKALRKDAEDAKRREGH